MKNCKNCEVLQARITDLEARLQLLQSKPMLQAGFNGERLVSRIVDGTITAFTVPHDVMTVRGRLLEVKYSNIGIPVKDQKTKRWSWGHVLGANGKKIFDNLILVGEKDHEMTSDIDPSDPYVFFDIPRPSVEKIMYSSGMVQLSTNPNTKKLIPRLLFDKFQTSMKVLTWRYGI